MDKKKCSCCQEERELNLFEKHRAQCRLCRKEKAKLRPLTPEQKERRKESAKRWAEENPEKRNAIYARYRKTDKRKKVANNWARKNRKTQTDRWRERYNTDPLFNLTIKARRRIYMALKKQETNKSGRTIRLLGCNFEEFKAHTESLFTEGMTWDKIRSGEIHIDHIKPCSSFDLSDPEQQKECFNYKNTQPLWATDNLKKNNKIIKNDLDTDP